MKSNINMWIQKLICESQKLICEVKYHVKSNINMWIQIIVDRNQLKQTRRQHPMHTHTKVFGVLPLQRHPSPLSGSIWFFIVFSILSLIFFLITVFTNIFFLSYHCFTYIFLFTVLLELIFFTFQHSLGYFWLVSVVHSTSLAAFSFSCYFRVLQTGILRGLGLFLRFWVFARTCFLFATLPT